MQPVLKGILPFFGIFRSKREVDKSRLRVLISGGYGYGNVGDEAQLAANLQQWRNASPNCRLTVLTPNREYTHDMHGSVRVELAPRKALFGLAGRQYFGSKRLFKFAFFWVAGICLINAYLVRAGLPTFCLTVAQARLLDEIKDTDVLFLSGGGYLTGMTLTRLWDNMLLIRLAHVLNVPTILSGQTIGLFKDPVSRFLAKWGLNKAKMIYLRDFVDSRKALEGLGISASKIACTFDDALFFEGTSSEHVGQLLSEAGIDPQKPYVAVNVHYWGQTPDSSRRIMRSMAGALRRLRINLGLQIVFVPMSSPDEKAIEEVRAAMEIPCAVAKHAYMPELAVSIIQKADLCITMKHHPIIFAMAAAVPTIAMVFDDYYHHKNLGAMKLFHNEEFLIKSTTGDFELELFEMARCVYINKVNISKSLANLIDELRPFSGAVIYRFLQQEGFR
jgi:polysaccharide pyruvyl transferase WcaK-like protein